MFDHLCARLRWTGHRRGSASAVYCLAEPWTTVAWALGPRDRTTLPPPRGRDCTPTPDPAGTPAVTGESPLRRVAGPLCLLVCLRIPWQGKAHRDRHGGRCAGRNGSTASDRHRWSPALRSRSGSSSRPATRPDTHEHTDV